MNYIFDNYGRFAGTSEAPTERSTETAPTELTPDYNWTGDMWVFAPIQPNHVVIPPPPEPVATQRTLTKLDYMNRFTDEELVGIYTVAKTAVQVEVWLEKFKIATDVDLDDPRTVAGVEALEQAGLLAAGRAAEILA